MSMDVYKVIKEIDTQNVIEIIDPCMDAGVIIRKMQHFVIKCCIFLYTYIIGKHGNYLTP